MKKTILTTLIILIVFFSVFSFGMYTPQTVYAAIGDPGNLECSSLIPFYCAIISGFEWVLSAIAMIPIAITSFLVIVSGLLLDVVVNDMIVNFSEYFNKASDSITEAWGTMRDLANIFFIFGLLTIAISTILGLQSYGYKKLLANLIIVALLINFSLFFTKFVIDVSNFFALQFYQAIAGVNGGAGISGVFMSKLGIDSLWDTVIIIDLLKSISSTGGIGLMFTYSFFVSTFFSITAFVFMFTAIMLIIRAVGFILLAIFSPLAFAALILPSTQNFAKQWWEKLWKYAIFAPVLFMFFWVTTTIMSADAVESISTGGLLKIFESDRVDQIVASKFIVNFLILITLMLASIIVSNKLSLAGSEKMMGLGNALKSGALRGALRGARTVGITWPRRRLATLSAEVEKDEGKKRKWYNPVRYAMNVVRPIGKVAMAFPVVGGLARQGLQATAATYGADVKSRATELEKYTTKQLVRRLSAATLPINRNAIAKVIEGRNDFDDLGFDEAGIARTRMLRRALKNAGLSTRNINRLRPDSFTKEEIWEGGKKENGIIKGGEFEKAIISLKPEDITKMHEDVIRNADKDIKEAILKTMVTNFSAKQANAAIRRLDEVGKEYLATLKKKSGENVGKETSDNINDIGKYLNNIVTEDQVDISIKKARTGTKEDKVESDRIRQQRSRLLTISDHIQKSPSQRAWGLTGGVSSSKEKTTVIIDTTGMTLGEQKLAREAADHANRPRSSTSNQQGSQNQKTQTEKEKEDAAVDDDLNAQE